VSGARKGVAGVRVALDPLALTVASTGVLPGPVSVNEVSVTVAGSIGSLNVATTFARVGASVDPAAGDLVSRVGGVPSVVKVQATFWARALPEESLTPVVRVAVYCVPEARGACGVSVAVLPVAETAAGTAAPPAAVRVNVESVTVAASSGLFRVADTRVPLGTLVAPSAGDFVDTVGALSANTTSTK
jgi:hypothetical protein